jgi:hypothetical protein
VFISFGLQQNVPIREALRHELNTIGLRARLYPTTM